MRREQVTKTFSLLRKDELTPPSFQPVRVRGGLAGAEECVLSFSSLEACSASTCFRFFPMAKWRCEGEEKRREEKRRGEET
jgi:hypothetical protein